MNTVPRVFAYLRRYPWLALGSLGCAVLGTLLIVVFPAVTKRVIDQVLIQHHTEPLGPSILAAALRNGLDSVRTILNNTFEP